MPRISKRIVDATKPDPTGRRLILWDSEIKGFGLLVLPTGVKTYFFRYRNGERLERRITIGKHGSWTPDTARRKASSYQRLVAEGQDPLKDRRALQTAPTVASLLDAYLDSERFRSKALSTQVSDKGRIDCHLKPLLGQRQVHALTPGDVERAFAAIRDGKTAKDTRTRPRGRSRVRGGEGAARMAIRLLRAAINWAIREGLVTHNPCAFVPLGNDGVRDVILETTEDYRRLFEALDRLEREGRLRAPAADAIRLIALTGARKGEVVNLCWNHVDQKRQLLVLPPKSHKTGRRTARPRIIGLPEAAQAVLARQPRGRPEDPVFQPTGGRGTISLSKPWDEVRIAAKLPKGAGLHCLRHSLASHMAMRGAGAAEIMTTLGHQQLSTTERYLHWAQDARQGLAERAAATVTAAMRPAAAPAQRPNRVTSFHTDNEERQRP